MKAIHATLLVLCAAPCSAQFLPDLATTSCNVTPQVPLNPGQSVVVSYEVCNVGQWGTAQFWQDRILINSSPTTAGAQVLQSHCLNFPNFLLPGQCYGTFGANPARTVVIPSGFGGSTAWIGYQTCVNGGFGDACGQAWVFPESTTSNNIAWCQVALNTRPDFEVSSLDAPPDLEPDGIANVNLTVANSGGSLGNGSIVVQLFLEPEGSPGSRIPLQAHPPVLIAPGQSLPLQFSFTVPRLTYGCYRFVAVADSTNAVLESNESNNERSRATVVSPAASTTPFGSGCGGSNGPPSLTANGDPVRDSMTFDLIVDTLLPFRLTVLHIGFVPLSAIDLTSLGMPGCSLLVAPDIQLDGFSQTETSVVFPIAIPGDCSSIGLTFDAQALVVAPGANPLGLAVSGAIACTIGS